MSNVLTTPISLQFYILHLPNFIIRLQRNTFPTVNHKRPKSRFYGYCNFSCDKNIQTEESTGCFLVNLLNTNLRSASISLLLIFYRTKNVSKYFLYRNQNENVSNITKIYFITLNISQYQ